MFLIRISKSLNYGNEIQNRDCFNLLTHLRHPTSSENTAVALATLPEFPRSAGIISSLQSTVYSPQSKVSQTLDNKVINEIQNYDYFYLPTY